MEKFSLSYSFVAIAHEKIPDFFVLIFIVDTIQKQRRDSMASSLFELAQPTLTKVISKQNYLLFGF